MIRELLRPGRENAVSVEDLTRATGYSRRQIVRLVKDERDAGEIILSASDEPYGYYLPGTQEEIRRFADSMRKRAISSFQALKPAAEALKQTDGQLEL